MVSIIVPVYKVEKYLRKCVESILSQTYHDIEVILVDDGSPDSCGKICDEYALADGRVKVIHQTNGGLSAARNAGIDIASGEFLSFVDSDDYIEPEMIERLLAPFCMGSCDISMCGCRTIDELGAEISTDSFSEEYLSGDELLKQVILPLKTASWNKLFSRKVIRDARFPIGKIHGEDLVFLSELIDRNVCLATVPYCGYNYVKHSGSITTSGFSERSFDEVFCKDTAAERIKNIFPDYEKQLRMWCFRARMNVLRKMMIHDAGGYLTQKHAYLRWLRENYGSLSKIMPFRMRIEYIAMMYTRKIYIGLLCRLEKQKCARFQK